VKDIMQWKYLQRTGYVFQELALSMLLTGYLAQMHWSFWPDSLFYFPYFEEVKSGVSDLHAVCL
jgi:hypothetical protein